MGLREAMKQRPALIGGAVTAAAAIVVGLSLWRIYNAASSDLPVFPNRQFYTTDDGATWFTDKDDRIPPFDIGDRQAVLANVYSCDGGKHKWVQYLLKYDDRGRKQLAELKEGKPLPTNGPGPIAGIMVKRPGPGEWVYQSDAAAQEIMYPHCPDGGSGPVEQELP